MFPPSQHGVYRSVVAKSIIHRWKGLNLIIKDKINFYTTQKSVEISKVKNMKKPQYYFSRFPKSKMWKKRLQSCVRMYELVQPTRKSVTLQFCHLWRHQLRFHLLVWKIGHKPWQHHKTTKNCLDSEIWPSIIFNFHWEQLTTSIQSVHSSIQSSRTQERKWTNERWNRTNNAIYIHRALNY
jgi:hypothetical protein